LSTPLATAQTPFLLHRKIAGDSLYVRWEPQDFAAFERVLTGGMHLEVYTVDRKSVV